MSTTPRRIVGFALFGSSALIGMTAAMFFAGIFGAADTGRLIGSILGGVAVLDAVLGLYFVWTG